MVLIKTSFEVMAFSLLLIEVGTPRRERASKRPVFVSAKEIWMGWKMNKYAIRDNDHFGDSLIGWLVIEVRVGIGK